MGLGLCMEDGCTQPATWRSSDGYPFCNGHAYAIYRAECALDGVVPQTASLWILQGRPHGPITT